ncbi:hypothetical protein ACHAXS_000804 [Conticribra weissflogii]
MEMKNFRVAFNASEDGRTELHGFYFACLVAVGHMANAPVTFTYTSVVTHETVHIAMMLAALTLLKVEL